MFSLYMGNAIQVSAKTLKIIIFCNIASCSLVVERRFRGAYFFLRLSLAAYRR
jgi:hypothetical protein